MLYRNHFKPVLISLLSFSALAAAPISAKEQPEEPRPIHVPRFDRPKVIFWEVVKNPEFMEHGVRFTGDVIAVAEETIEPHGFGVILTLRNDLGQEVGIKIFDKRGFNEGLHNYGKLLGKRISILLTYKFYGITEATPQEP